MRMRCPRRTCANAGERRGAAGTVQGAARVPACVTPNTKVERVQVRDPQPAARTVSATTDRAASRDVRYLVQEY